MLLLLPVFGIRAIWISYALCYVIFLAIMFLFRTLRLHHPLRTVDDLMLLPPDYYETSNLFNITLTGDKESAETIVNVGPFLEEKGLDERTVYICSLCLEEIFVKIAEGPDRPRHIDIRLFISDGKVRFSVRDDGPMTIRFLFDESDEFDGIGIKIVRGMADEVEPSM